MTASHASAPPPHHGLDQCQTREGAAGDRLLEDTALLRLSGAHLHCVLRQVYTVVTPGRFVPQNPEHECTEVAVSGDDLRQTNCEDAVAFL